MGTFVITFRSVTPAQRAERVLRGAGLRCNLGRTPRWMEEQGCGYSLRVHNGEAEQLVSLLHSNRVQFRKLYRLLDNGVMEEVGV